MNISSINSVVNYDKTNSNNITINNQDENNENNERHISSSFSVSLNNIDLISEHRQETNINITNKRQSIISNQRTNKMNSLSIKERIFSSEISLYKKYNQSPLLLYSHLGLVVTLVYYLYSLISFMSIINSHEQAICNIYDYNIGTSQYILSIDEFKTHVSNITNSFNSFSSNFLNVVKVDNLNSLFLKIEPFDQQKQMNPVKIKDFKSPFEEMSNKEVKDFMSMTNQVSISIKYMIFFENSIITCSKISINYVYSFISRVYIEFYPVIDREACSKSENTNESFYNLIFFSSLLIFISIFQLVVSFQRVYYSFKVMFQIKNSLIKNGKKEKWNSLSFSNKLSFFNLWYFMFIVNSLIIIYCKYYCLYYYCLYI